MQSTRAELLWERLVPRRIVAASLRDKQSNNLTSAARCRFTKEMYLLVDPECGLSNDLT